MVDLCRRPLQRRRRLCIWACLLLMVRGSIFADHDHIFPVLLLLELLLLLLLYLYVCILQLLLGRLATLKDVVLYCWICDFGRDVVRREDMVGDFR